MEGTFIVDIECLTGISGAYVVKELAIYQLAENPKEQSWMFKPPYEEYILSKETRKQNYWVTNNLHGIRWDDGDVEYSEFHRILRQSIPAGSKVYVKGKEKSNYISEHLSSDVIDLSTLKCPKAKDIWFPQVSCFFHHLNHNFKHCAVSKTAKFAEWLTLHSKQSDIKQDKWQDEFLVEVEKFCAEIFKQHLSPKKTCTLKS